MSILIFIFGLLMYLAVFWGFYVLVMGLYRAHLDKRLQGLNKWLAMPYLAIGAILDVLANIFIATFVFLELPQEWLVTTRLRRYMKRSGGKRKYIAQYICDHLLDPFDPKGNHC